MRYVLQIIFILVLVFRILVVWLQFYMFILSMCYMFVLLDGIFM